MSETIRSYGSHPGSGGCRNAHPLPTFSLGAMPDRVCQSGWMRWRGLGSSTGHQWSSCQDSVQDSTGTSVCAGHTGSFGSAATAAFDISSSVCARAPASSVPSRTQSGRPAAAPSSFIRANNRSSTSDSLTMGNLLVETRPDDAPLPSSPSRHGSDGGRAARRDQAQRTRRCRCSSHRDGGPRPGRATGPDWRQSRRQQAPGVRRHTVDLGIDLGTATTVVSDVRRGIVFDEPSVMLLRSGGGRREKIFAVGREAADLLGRAPSRFVAVRPVQDGVVTDLETTRSYLRSVLHAGGRRGVWGLPVRAVIVVPVGSSALENRALLEAAEEAGIRPVTALDGAIAGAV